MKNQPSIARLWHGAVPEEKSEEYTRYLQQTGVKDYRETEGNLGVKILVRKENGLAHFLLITYWDSYDSIRAFAGDEIERARYYPEDDDYLVEMEPFVTHYEIVSTPV